MYTSRMKLAHGNTKTRSITNIWLLFLLMGLVQSVFGQQTKHNPLYYAGIETGPALLSLSSSAGTKTSTNIFSLGFYGGFTPLPKLRVGINLNGNLIETYGGYAHPDKGISISNIHLHMQAMPFSSTAVFINMQGGYANYVNHNPDGFNTTGASGKLGIGYKRTLGKYTTFQSTLNYGLGFLADVKHPGVNITDQHFQLVELLIGITVHKTKKE